MSQNERFDDNEDIFLRSFVTETRKVGLLEERVLIIGL
jgi:hypothetical protein